MIRLNFGNVLLKPSQRRQLMTWLKRAQKIGGQVGDFFLTITLHRCGHATEVTADVHNAAGDFSCRIRRSQWQDALQEIAELISNRLHAQRLGLPLA